MNEKEKIKKIETFLEGYVVKFEDKETTLNEAIIKLKIDLDLSHLAEELTKLGLNE